MAKKKKRGRPPKQKEKKKRGRPPKKQQVVIDDPVELQNDNGLNPRQLLFVYEYLKDFNATQAAIRAGYSKKTAGVIGYENLKKPYILQEIRRESKERLDKIKITSEEVLKELSRVARSDILDYLSFDNSGVALHDSSGLTEGQARAIQAIKETFSSDGHRQIEFKLHNKINALDLLAKHFQLYQENTLNVNITWADIAKSASEAKKKRQLEEEKKLESEKQEPEEKVE